MICYSEILVMERPLHLIYTIYVSVTIKQVVMTNCNQTLCIILVKFMPFL